MDPLRCTREQLCCIDHSARLALAHARDVTLGVSAKVFYGLDVRGLGGSVREVFDVVLLEEPLHLCDKGVWPQSFQHAKHCR